MATYSETTLASADRFWTVLGPEAKAHWDKVRPAISANNEDHAEGISAIILTLPQRP